MPILIFIGVILFFFLAIRFTKFLMRDGAGRIKDSILKFAFGIGGVIAVIVIILSVLGAL